MLEQAPTGGRRRDDRRQTMSIPERPTRILAVDDEEQIRRALRSILGSRGYVLNLAATADEALMKAIDEPPDLVILDLMLPDRSGIEVCRELRTWMSAPILILSVRSAEADKIKALDEGADDYLTKPFSAGELLARIRALLRRAAALTSPPPLVTVGDLDIDIARRRVTLAGADRAGRRREDRRQAMSIPERPTRILAVDDEEQIRRALQSILGSRGYILNFAATADEALMKAIDEPPDLVILDLMLPDRSGIEVCRELRTWMSAPILILSVRSAEADKIKALDEGADDYLTKPFSAGELLARIRALLRRAAALTSPPPVVTVGDLEIDIARRRVTLAGADVALTPTEFDILAFLARNADLVVTQKMILEHVWGPEWVEDAQTLRVHVSHLRKKIEPLPAGPRYIITEPGVGFRLAVPATALFDQAAATG
jgi:two-component system KDP operon response regulator KdpE